MDQSAVDTVPSAPSIEAVLREELAQNDALAGTFAPVLRHLLANDDHSIFSEEVVARTHGILADFARQLLDELAVAAKAGEEREYPQDVINALVAAMIDSPPLLAHVHALSVEWQLISRMQARLGIDPVLSPLLQALVASPEPEVAANAMALLASQARFAQSQRRMQLPLAELPAEQLHHVLTLMRGFDGLPEFLQPHCTAAEATIRQRFDESRSRLGLMSRIIAGMGGGASVALSVTHAGVSLFLSAVALAAGQARDMAVMATNESQLARLALVLRSAGLKPAAIEEQFLALHPGVALPEGFDTLGVDQAAALLARSTAYPGG